MRIRLEKHRLRSAFTLLEMIVVVAIIVALAGIGGFALLNQLESTKRETAHAQAKGPISGACKAFFVKNSRFPNDLSELLSHQVPGGPYLEDESALRDPWGNFFQFQMREDNNGTTKPYIFTQDPSTGATIDNWTKPQ